METSTKLAFFKRFALTMIDAMCVYFCARYAKGNAGKAFELLNFAFAGFVCKFQVGVRAFWVERKLWLVIVFALLAITLNLGWLRHEIWGFARKWKGMQATRTMCRFQVKGFNLPNPVLSTLKFSINSNVESAGNSSPNTLSSFCVPGLSFTLWNNATPSASINLKTPSAQPPAC